jgi:hypothetical protein
MYMPRQFRTVQDARSLYPFQQEIRDGVHSHQNEDTIHVVHDPVGATGKATIAGIMVCNGLALELPAMVAQSGHSLLFSAYKMLQTEDRHSVGTLFITLPKVLDTSKHTVLLKAIRDIKDGRFDKNSDESWWNGSRPAVWVFTTWIPAAARQAPFMIWTINANKQLSGGGPH